LTAKNHLNFDLDWNFWLRFGSLNQKKPLQFSKRGLRTCGRDSLEEVSGNKRSEEKNAGVYLLKKYTGATNTEIGKLFGGISYSEVAKISQNFSRLMADDTELRGRIKNVLVHISTFKG
jgi:hypothetical protein